MKRKPIPKEVRRQVYDKYNGHCAYCGCELDIKDMQIDHLHSVYRAEIEGKKEDNSIDNFMPSCRMCNFYKGTTTIEDFRKKILTFQDVYLPDNFTTRLALKYGMATLSKWDGEFYFEKWEKYEHILLKEV